VNTTDVSRGTLHRLNHPRIHAALRAKHLIARNLESRKLNTVELARESE
jgi:hypothetical protein